MISFLKRPEWNYLLIIANLERLEGIKNGELKVAIRGSEKVTPNSYTGRGKVR